MNANAKNLPEFKALIERYETITLEEINKALVDEIKLLKEKVLELQAIIKENKI